MQKIRNKAAVFFSGGVDSTLVALHVAEQFAHVTLITCITHNHIAPTKLHEVVRYVQEKAPNTVIESVVLPAKKIMAKIWNGLYLKDMLTVGVYRTYPCTPCKFAMYIRGLVYCLNHDITHIFDGSNIMMSFDPCQNYHGQAMLQSFFLKYGIIYEAPVYWYENEDIMFLSQISEFIDDPYIQAHLLKGQKTQDEAKKRGMGKGDMKLDTQTQYAYQPLCTQSVYVTYFIRYFYLPTYGYKKLENVMKTRLQNQISYIGKSLDAYIKDKSHKHILCETD